jgi:hypothetical protein
MEFISWQEWYRRNKGLKPLNEITCDYNVFCNQYYSYNEYQTCTSMLGSETQYLLQENRKEILQENGFNIIWQINQ